MTTTPLRIAAVAAVLCLPLGASADHLTEWTFPLTTAQTNPPASFPGGATLPSGLASVVIDSDAMTISWDIDYQDLTGPIVAPGAHFHGPAMQGANAGVQIFLSDGDPPEPASGNLSGMAALSNEQLSDVLGGLWYLNIHTGDNMSGELRGQVVNGVPEPATLLLLASAAGMATTARRRRG